MRIRSSRGMRGALVIGFTVVGATAARAAMDERLPREYQRADQEEVASRADALADQLIPLPSDVTVQRHVIGPDGIQRDGAGTDPEGKLIYNSTHGSWLALLDWDGTELRTTAVDAADMTSFIVRVSGGVEEGEGEFACTMRLHDTLPSCGGQLIPGTEYTFEGLSDSIDIVHELMVDVSGDPVPIPRLAWAYVSCDAASAGWLIGPLPEIGYSTHRCDYPWGYCCSGGCGYPLPLPSSRYVQVFVPEDSPTEFLTYLTLNGCAYPYVPWGGSGVRVADDLMLVHEGCELSSFELGVVGDAGPYEMSIDLRVHPTLGPIPGTERVFVGEGDGSLEIARFTFGPGIELPQNVWITWKPNREHTGTARAGRGRVGFTARTFMMEDFPGVGGWHSYLHFEGVFHAGVYCRGDPPTGACCLEPALRLYDGQCIDDLPKISCGGRWIEGATCVDEPFDPPCGTHACCKPDNSCADVTEEECANEAGFWEEDDFCGVNGQDCGWFACRDTTDDCYIGHLLAGCWWRSCCNEICDIDPWCCTESWSATCVRLAEEECDFRPRHDACWEIEYRTVREAREIAAQGTTIVTNKHATYSPEDPFVCCHVQGVDHYSLNTMWFRFRATDNSARISTCGTADGDGTDSIIQVYRVADSDLGRCQNHTACSVTAQDCPDGSTCVFDGEAACQTVEIIGCNDDSPHCDDGSGWSDVCVTGLMPGDIYYIMLASPTPNDAGVYQLDLESPCPIMPPDNDYCEAGFLMFDETVPFDLAYATIDCPGEPCVNAMKNDLWYEYIASCTGNLIVETHGLTPEDDDPETTLVVYDDFTCPPDPDSVLGCAEGSSLAVPVFSCQNYLVRLGGVFGSEPAGQVTFTCVEDDCQPNGIPDALDISGGTSEDNDGNGIPDECDPHFMAYMAYGPGSLAVQIEPGVRYHDDLHLATSSCELRSYGT